MKTKKKQTQISIEEYIEIYCREKRIRERSAVYISSETHEKLRKAARIFYEKHHTTVSSLADSIISRHIKTHRELLNDAHEESHRDLLEWLRSGSEEEDSEQQPGEVEPGDNQDESVE